MNRITKKLFSLCLTLSIIITLCACTPKATITEISLGEGLPVIRTEDPYYEASLPEDAEIIGMVKTYATQTNQPDIDIYNIPKTKEETLESFGQQQAKDHGVFCDMIKKDGVPAAVLNFYQPVGKDRFIIQEFIFEGKDQFVIVDYRFKTEKTPLGNSGLSFYMIKGYKAEDQLESAFAYEKTFTTDNDNLPTVRVCQFDKKNFSAESFRTMLLNNTSSEKPAVHAEKDWTLEDLIEMYKADYDVKKAEIMNKNGLNIAFIGYVDQGIFYVRAFIDHGTDMILLGCEKEAAKFRHMTNAFLDSIE